MLSRSRKHRDHREPFPPGESTLDAAAPVPLATGAQLPGNYASQDVCLLVEAHLPAFHDRELEASLYAEIATHLLECPACAEVYRSLQHIDCTLKREWPHIMPLPSLQERKQAVDRIMTAIPGLPGDPDSLPPRSHARSDRACFIVRILNMVLSGWSSLPGWLRTRPARITAHAQKQPAQPVTPPQSPSSDRLQTPS
ncbi:MAG: zf-HC2 domain-containing protein [Chloroherpetonaceae bacterium]|nr:zf-HC2 domain-containing protein [Chthonomonadaceae bacterium]MDW8209070.1 zf-HC2 domain-containing protein [Chloroherpetonaceae bacterium]